MWNNYYDDESNKHGFFSMAFILILEQSIVINQEISLNLKDTKESCKCKRKQGNGMVQINKILKTWTICYDKILDISINWGKTFW